MTETGDLNHRVRAIALAETAMRKDHHSLGATIPGTATGAAQNGNHPLTVSEIRLEGHFRSVGFLDWICHRAHLLDLRGWVTAQGPARISIVVEGPQALIDAMEMACSLGPVDVQVARIEVLPRQPSQPLPPFAKL